MLGHCYKIFKLLILKEDITDNAELQITLSIYKLKNRLKLINLILTTINKITLNITILVCPDPKSKYILLHKFILKF